MWLEDSEELGNFICFKVWEWALLTVFCRDDAGVRFNDLSDKGHLNAGALNLFYKGWGCTFPAAYKEAPGTD